MRQKTKVGLALAALIVLVYLTFIHIYYEIGTLKLTLYNLFRVCHMAEQIGGFFGLAALASSECSTIYFVFFSLLIAIGILGYYVWSNRYYITFSASQVTAILLGIAFVYLFNRGILTFNPTTLAIGVNAPIAEHLSSILNASKLSKYNITPIGEIVGNPSKYLNKYVCVYGTLKERSDFLWEVNSPPKYYIEDKEGYYIYIVPERYRKYNIGSNYVICGYFREKRKTVYIGWRVQPGEVLYYYIEAKKSEKI